MSERESASFDVVIVGGGPAGLASAIRLKQLDAALSVCIIEKGSEIGAHILSGAVCDPKALDELLPNWREDGCSMAETPVTDNWHWVLTRRSKIVIPHFTMPPLMSNRGNYTGSLGNLCRWMAGKAENLGVEIFIGFSAAGVLFDEKGAVRGVATGDAGIARNGSRRPHYQPGAEILAKYTIIAEGARGHLSKQLKARYNLERDCQPQVYGIGIKELWDIPPAKHRPGRVLHTQGWPLSESDSWGGGFLYHQSKDQVALGLVTVLDYKNPYVSPFEEFQRWKQHPEIRKIIEGGRRVAYGARAINEGGWQSVPKLVFPGGLLAGCSAGFVNVPRLKGIHNAMKSGMLAAEAITTAIHAGREHDELDSYSASIRDSWIASELKLARNSQPLAAKFRGGIGAMLFTGTDLWMRTLRIGLPFTMKHTPNASATGRADLSKPIAYPKPDGVISFDRLTSVSFSFTNHEEDQPCHLKLKDPTVPTRINLPLYAGLEARYCPAGVYEFFSPDGTAPRLQINVQNCIHCKTCDIKDPTGNIDWLAPEGGGGPNYPNM